MSSCVYAGFIGSKTASVPRGSIWKFDLDGNLVDSTYDVNNTIDALAADDQGNVVGAWGNQDLVKYDSDLNEVWRLPLELGSTFAVTDVAIARDGHIYACTESGLLIKVTPSGTEVWRIPVGSVAVSKVAVDRAGNVIVARANGSAYTLRKYSPSGSMLWEHDDENIILELDVDHFGYVYIGTTNSQVSVEGTKVKKFTPSGSFLWEHTFSSTLPIEGLSVDGQGYVYVSTKDSFSYTPLSGRISPDGTTTEWSFPHPRSGMDCATDGSGNAYVGTKRLSNSDTYPCSIIKVNSSGIVWEKTYKNYESVACVAVDYMVVNEDPPVIITPSGGSTDVAEGGPGDTYEVVLSRQPSADVIVNVTPDSQLQVDKPSLTFTPENWNVPQTVTVTAIDDNIDE